MSILLISSPDAQQWFSSVDTNFAATATIIAQGYRFQTFLTARHTVVRPDGVRSPSRSNNDLVLYIPIVGSATDGYRYIAHETYAAGWLRSIRFSGASAVEALGHGALLA